MPNSLMAALTGHDDEKARAATLAGKLLAVAHAVEQEIWRAQLNGKEPSELYLGFLEMDLVEALRAHNPELSRAKAEEYFLRIRKEHEQQAEQWKRLSPLQGPYSAGGPVN